MAHKVIDRCKETTSTTGTGNLTLTGPVTGFVSVANATTGLTSNGDTSWFCAESGSQWEIFLGTRVSATELARSLISSSTGSTINFTNPPVVFSTVPARPFVGPVFRAYRSGGDQSLTSSAFVKCLLDATEFDTDALFDTSQNRFTPNVAGYYRLEWDVSVNASSGLTMGFSQLRKNGAAYSNGTYAAQVYSYMQSTGSALVYLNGTGDYVDLWAYAVFTSGGVLLGGLASTFLSGSFVRA